MVILPCPSTLVIPSIRMVCIRLLLITKAAPSGQVGYAPREYFAQYEIDKVCRRRTSGHEQIHRYALMQWNHLGFQLRNFMRRRSLVSGCVFDITPCQDVFENKVVAHGGDIAGYSAIAQR